MIRIGRRSSGAANLVQGRGTRSGGTAGGQRRMGSRCLPSSPALRTGRGRSGRRKFMGLDLARPASGVLGPTWDAEVLADLEGAGVEVVDRLEVGHRRADVAAVGGARPRCPTGSGRAGRSPRGSARAGRWRRDRRRRRSRGRARRPGRRRARPGGRGGSAAACSAAAGRPRGDVVAVVLRGEEVVEVDPAKRGLDQLDLGGSTGGEPTQGHAGEDRRTLVVGDDPQHRPVGSGRPRRHPARPACDAGAWPCGSAAAGGVNRVVRVAVMLLIGSSWGSATALSGRRLLCLIPV